MTGLSAMVRVMFCRGVALGVGEAAVVGVGDGVAVGVGDGVAVGVGDGVAMGVGDGVAVGVGDGVAVGVGDGVAVGVSVGIGVADSTAMVMIVPAEGAAVGVLVGISVGVAVGIAVGVDVVNTAVADGVGDVSSSGRKVIPSCVTGCCTLIGSPGGLRYTTPARKPTRISTVATTAVMPARKRRCRACSARW